MDNLTGETASVQSSYFPMPPWSRRFGYRFEIAEAIKRHLGGVANWERGRTHGKRFPPRILGDTIHRPESDGSFAGLDVLGQLRLDMARIGLALFKTRLPHL
jgi:hypothetical protein